MAFNLFRSAPAQSSDAQGEPVPFVTSVSAFRYMNPQQTNAYTELYRVWSDGTTEKKVSTNGGPWTRWVLIN